MGLDTSVVKFLLGSHKRGVDFSSTLMLGRQSFFPSPALLPRMLRWHDAGIAPEQVTHLRQTIGKYSEPFLEFLGATDIQALDNAPYEGAAIQHDLNKPIPDELEETCSLLLDGGTLEHVFHFPNAIHNCMRLVKSGGHLITVNGTNNFTGHGFYQFSAELLFRVLGPENGFHTEAIFLREVAHRGYWWRAQDPATFGGRAGLVNSKPTYIFVLARKTGPTPKALYEPQQSDYTEVWSRKAASDSNHPFQHAPERVPPPKFTSACYRRIEEGQFLLGEW